MRGSSVSIAYRGVGVSGRGSNFGETDCRVLFRTVPHLWHPTVTCGSK